MTSVATPELQGRPHWSSWTWLSPLVHPLDRAEILLVYVAFPMALVGDLAGISMGAVGWILAFLVGLLAFLLLPLPAAVLRTTAPLFALLCLGIISLLWTISFTEGVRVLVQFAAVLVAYLAGWRAMAADQHVPFTLSNVSIWLIPACLIVFFNAAVDGASTFGWVRGGNAARPMVMMLALLFLMGSLGRSRRFTLVLWGAAFLIAVASGGRMGVAVIGLMLILTPALRVGWKPRLALVGVGLAALAFLIQFEGIQERLFVGQEEGELTDILTLEGNFNTAGRNQNWPQVIALCSDHSTFGQGAGSSGPITLEATVGRTSHPHNDYLRIWCEYGYTGSVMFWGFFLMVGLRGWRLFRYPGASQIESELGAIGGLAVVALLMFALTDNVVVYTATFMAAGGVLWGISDRALHEVESRPIQTLHDTRASTGTAT
ncbi:MAG TPA: O-antigen ligase family protein [Acidimicrobiia bacterium]|nr:O-antigen ligase family protein [Acidimicrobiia bacterium]